MEQFQLSNESIDLMCEKTTAFLSAAKVEKREALRIRLALEEVLLQYQAQFGESASCRLRTVRRLNTRRVELILPGASFDPFAGEEENEMSVLRGVLAGMGLAPVWSYKNGKNHVVFLPRKKPVSQSAQMALAVVLAVVLGMVINLLPAAGGQGVSNWLLSPVTNMLMGLISAVSGPLIFLSITSSICSMGDLDTLGTIGKKTIGGLLGNVTIGALLMAGGLMLAMPFESAGGGGFDPTQLMEVIYGIVPGNFFTPFTQGNAIQIIFLAVVCGVTMLALSNRVNMITGLIEQLTVIVQTIMSGVAAFLPVLVFVMLLNIIVCGQVFTILNAYKIVLWMAGLSMGFLVIMILWVALRKRVSPVQLVKKTLPVFLIGLTTASSAAVMNTSVQDMEQQMGVHKKLSGFAVPLGQIVYMPGFVATLMAMEFCLAKQFDVAITPSWVLIALVINVILSVAAPPVPGGAASCFSIAFLQLGIPAEAVAIALTVDAFTDFLCTATNVSTLQMALIGIADSLHLLDKETLRKQK